MDAKQRWPAARFQFAGFVLDADWLELRRGSERIEVQPKALHLLCYLLENAERTVTKEELLKALWPDTIVSEGSLTTAVRLARRALGERQRESQIVRTVHGLGYRLGVPVTREVGRLEIRKAAVEAVSRPAELSDALNRPALIVLPFINLSNDAEQEYFVDGITEDVTTALSGVRDLTVMSRNLAFLYKGKPVSPQQLRDEFGIRYVVEGSVRRVNNRIRINIQLTDATTGGHVWAERYDRGLADIFEVQSEIVETICGRLRLELLDYQQEPLRRKPTGSLSAYESCLRGRAWMRKNTPDGIRKAQGLFENAVSLDPNYADGYQNLATVDVALWLLLYDTESERLERAERRIRRALELDDFSGRAHGTLSVLRWIQGRFQEALEAAREAVRLLPVDRTTWLYQMGKIHISLGQWQAAQDSVDAALHVDPRYSFGGDLWNTQAVLHHVHGRIDAAKTSWERGRQANSALLSPRLWLAYQYINEDERRRAGQVAREIRESWPEMTAERALEYWYLFGYQPEPTAQMIAKLREAGLP